ncbi:MAG TPA: hypothetical protein DCO93_03580 [Clostridiales bacterium]|nr:hypothetical protein [Clostridiales bacterium]
MKKLVSLIAVVAMLSGVFATSAFAANFPVGPAVLMSAVREATEDEIDAYNTYVEDELEEDLPGEEYSLYAIDIAIGGLGSFTNTNTAASPTGILPELVTCQLDFGSDFSNLFSLSDEPVVAFEGLLSNGSAAVAGGTVLTIKYLLNDGKSVGKNVTIDEEEVIISAIIALSDNSSATVVDASITLGEFTKSKSHTDSKNYKPSEDNISFSPASLVFGESAPATVDVTSVTISGATNATVGDDVQLSATVLPDNATDKTVTWTKVSGNGAVSDSGVVTATAAGDVVVKATAGGVDSANYTVSFAAPAPTPVYTDSSIDVKKPVNGTTGLTDLQGQDVTLTANYGIAKFSKAIDTVANKYFVVATDSNDVEKEFEVDFAANGVEISNASTTFFAIVKSADHIIKNIRLKEIAR